MNAEIRAALKTIENLSNDKTRINDSERKALKCLIEKTEYDLEHPTHIKKIYIEHDFSTYELDDMDKTMKTLYMKLLNKFIEENIMEYRASELTDGVKSVRVIFSVDVVENEDANLFDVIQKHSKEQIKMNLNKHLYDYCEGGSK